MGRSRRRLSRRYGAMVYGRAAGDRVEKRPRKATGTTEKANDDHLVSDGQRRIPSAAAAAAAGRRSRPPS